MKNDKNRPDYEYFSSFIKLFYKMLEIYE